jgi:short-subunit dehydrogenase
VDVPIALVTGPTTGIGRAFAEGFARRGFSLVLVSRNTRALDDLARSVTADFGVECEVLTADLTQREDVDRVAERILNPASPIAALVNNAGFSLRTSFLRDSVDDEQRLLDVLVTAVMRLTHAALPGMVERGSGMVINVSSVASWITGGSYSAAKSYVTVLSESLQQEVAGTGVRVIAVCPGFVHTEFHSRADIDMSGLPEFMWVDASRVVDQAFRDLARNRSVSVAGAQYRMIATVMRNGPRALGRAATSLRGRNPRFGKKV